VNGSEFTTYPVNGSKIAAYPANESDGNAHGFSGVVTSDE